MQQDEYDRVVNIHALIKEFSQYIEELKPNAAAKTVQYISKTDFKTLSKWITSQQKEIDVKVIQKFAIQLISIVSNLQVKCGIQHNNIHEETIKVKRLEAGEANTKVITIGEQVFQVNLEEGDLEVMLTDFRFASVRTANGAEPTQTWATSTISKDHWWSTPVARFFPGIFDQESDMYMIGTVLLNIYGHRRKDDFLFTNVVDIFNYDINPVDDSFMATTKIYSKTLDSKKVPYNVIMSFNIDRFKSKYPGMTWGTYDTAPEMQAQTWLINALSIDYLFREQKTIDDVTYNAVLGDSEKKHIKTRLAWLDTLDFATLKNLLARLMAFKSEDRIRFGVPADFGTQFGLTVAPFHPFFKDYFKGPVPKIIATPGYALEFEPPLAYFKAATHRTKIEEFLANPPTTKRERPADATDDNYVQVIVDEQFFTNVDVALQTVFFSSKRNYKFDVRTPDEIIQGKLALVFFKNIERFSLILERGLANILRKTKRDLKGGSIILIATTFGTSLNERPLTVDQNHKDFDAMSNVEMVEIFTKAQFGQGPKTADFGHNDLTTKNELITLVENAFNPPNLTKIAEAALAATNGKANNVATENTQVGAVTTLQELETAITNLLQYATEYDTAAKVALTAARNAKIVLTNYNSVVALANAAKKDAEAKKEALDELIVSSASEPSLKSVLESAKSEMEDSKTAFLKAKDAAENDATDVKKADAYDSSASDLKTKFDELEAAKTAINSTKFTDINATVIANLIKKNSTDVTDVDDKVEYAKKHRKNIADAALKAAKDAKPSDLDKKAIESADLGNIVPNATRYRDNANLYQKAAKNADEKKITVSGTEAENVLKDANAVFTEAEQLFTNASALKGAINTFTEKREAADKAKTAADTAQTAITDPPTEQDSKVFSTKASEYAAAVAELKKAAEAVDDAKAVNPDLAKEYAMGTEEEKDAETLTNAALDIANKVGGETARKAKEEADRKAKEDADKKTKEDAERKAKEDAERTAKEEADRKAKEDAERKAKEDADRKAKEDADKKAKEESYVEMPIAGFQGTYKVPQNKTTMEKLLKTNKVSSTSLDDIYTNKNETIRTYQAAGLVHSTENQNDPEEFAFGLYMTDGDDLKTVI